MIPDQTDPSTTWFLCAWTEGTEPFAPSRRFTGVHAEAKAAVDFLFVTQRPVLAIYVKPPRGNPLQPEPPAFGIADPMELEQYLGQGYSGAVLIDYDRSIVQLQVHPVFQLEPSPVPLSRTKPRLANPPAPAYHRSLMALLTSPRRRAEKSQDEPEP